MPKNGPGIGSKRRGYDRNHGYTQIVCRFDDETFAQIRQRALKHQTSMAEQLRTLVEWGLEADNEGLSR